MARRDIPTSTSVPVVFVCLGALLLGNVLIYLYLDSLHHSDDRPMSPHAGCPPGHFRLTSMQTCWPRLRCEQVEAEVRRLKLIGQGAVKQVGFSRVHTESGGTARLHTKYVPGAFQANAPGTRLYVDFLRGITVHPLI